jgi:excisionase family DNA binding protein
MAEYLSTHEVARYLKLNQKKVYALVASGQLPAARISGKWLFPKELIDRWVAEHTVYPPGGFMGALLDQLLVLQGSDDWLLGRVIQAIAQPPSGTPVPTAFVGSLAGLSALAGGRAHIASCHVSPSVVSREAKGPVYRLALYAREQGILFDKKRSPRINGLESLCRGYVRFAQRQPGSGTSLLVERLLAGAKVEPKWKTVGPFGSHLELALAIRNGQADAGVGVQIAAHLVGLDFAPLMREQFDLVIPSAFMSHKRVSEFLERIVDGVRAEAAHAPPGYSFEDLGQLQPLGAGPNAAP